MTSVTVHQATEEDLPVVMNLLSYYIYDMSEYMGWACMPDGRFGGCDELRSHWSEAEKHAFILRADAEPAGFALVRGCPEDEGVDYSIAEFFVLRKFRHRGVGQRVAGQLFDRFRGRWKVAQLAPNTPAIAFWRKVIGRYTGGQFREGTEESPWGERNVIRFRNDTGGAARAEADGGTAPALLVIDMQRRFLEQGHPEKLARVGALIASANELIDCFHDRGLPVVHIQTIHKADRSTWNQWMKEHDAAALIEGTREAEVHPDVHVADTDIVVRKTRHSAFIRTELEQLLTSRAIGTLALVGFSTDLCVGLTAVEAYERDFTVVLAGDAILGTNPSAGSRMLDYLSDHFDLVPVPNAQVVRMLSEHAAH